MEGQSPKARYECKSCGAITDFKWDADVNDISCACKVKGNWQMLSLELSDELINEARIEYGKIFEELCSIIDYYIDKPFDDIMIDAIWIIGTYLHKAFSTYPHLYYQAMKGSGKTRMLGLIANLAYGANGEVHSNPTEAVLFRRKPHATLVFDESENIASKEKAQFRQYLNASYKKGITVQRMKKVKTKDGENQIVETFEPFRPIVTANINGLDDVLADRCLTQILQKSQDCNRTKKIEDFENNLQLQQLKVRLTRFSVVVCSVVVSKHITQSWNNYINMKYPSYQTTSIHYIHNIHITTLNYTKEEEELFLKIDNIGINGRNLELIFPLIITAYSFSTELAYQLLDILSNRISVKQTEEYVEDRDVSVYDFVSEASRYQFDYVNMNELAMEFRNFVGQVDKGEDWINAKWLGQALKRLNLVTSKKRVARGICVLLNSTLAKEKLKMFKRDY